MHIVYAQFRYRNNVQAIHILSVQYGYWQYCGNVQYMVTAIPPHSSSRPWCHQSSFRSVCNFTLYPFCMHNINIARGVSVVVIDIPQHIWFQKWQATMMLKTLGRFLNGFAMIITSEKRKTARQWPKRRLMASRRTQGQATGTWRMWRDGSNHNMIIGLIHIIIYCRNSHTVHSICILLAQYVYCLRVVPIFKLRVSNMHIAVIAMQSITVLTPLIQDHVTGGGQNASYYRPHQHPRLAVL